jgi:DNA-binding beta-propeller fold protein YncE
VFITGGASGEDFDYLTVAYDAASGEVRWAKRYEGPRTGARDIASSIAIAPDGSSVYVTGGSTSPDRSLDYATLAYEASTGTMRWVRRFGVRIIGSGDGARAVAVSPDGSKVLVTGRSYRGDISGRDMATIEYDASTGAIVWVRLYGHLLHESERATSLAVSPDGSTVFVTGNRFHNDGYDFATVAYEI